MLWGLMLAFVQTVSAQTNPVDGIVITNEGDTLHGTLDYLSSNINAMECHFRKEGDSEFKVYTPGEIKGYRFLSDGVFYVTKTMPVDKVDRTFFAEFLLQGGMSLYRYVNGGDYFFIENENGEVAQIVNDGITLMDKTKIHNKLGPAYYMFSKSEKAKQQLATAQITAKSLTKITRDYDMEYCRENGDCVQFQYDTKKSRRGNAHLMVSLGGEMMQCKEYDEAKWCVSPSIGVGVYATFPRINKHLALEASASVAKYTFTYGKEVANIYNVRYQDWSSPDEHIVKWTCVSVPIMLNYLFSKDENVATPYLAFGFNNTLGFSNEVNNLLFSFLRPSAALGMNIPISNHLLRISAKGSILSIVSSKTRKSEAHQDLIFNLCASYIF